MKITIIKDEVKFTKDFMPLITELWYGNKFDMKNQQHMYHLKYKIHATFVDFGTALCAYEDDNTPIGFIWYKHDTGIEGVSFSGKYAHIIQYGLFEQYRNKGIGTKLLNEAINIIKSSGGECLYTDTYTENKDSMIFYLKRNFVPVTLLPGLNGINDDGQVFLYRVL
ncbi:MAG: hypothetical protein A2Y17_01850 [Clostridiales bacterium GWF2_38_85]|nr:MAG: hypothetical protein A2Y17_01850 [Clostridiales bacterium GWF2_38_85]HBL84746.1 hypothetical protein [Clostridiales bacterium]